MNYKFWKDWKNKTTLEKRYIKSLENALTWLKNQTFAKDIISVYVKGSFVDRELNKDSDIDVVPIVKNKKILTLLRETRDKHKESLRPVDLLPMTIQELKNNKRYKKPFAQRVKGTQGKPDQFTLLLKYNKLIYGKQLNPRGWKVRTEQKVYDNLKDAMTKQFLPLYQKKEFGFRQFAKQFMHLIYWEERLKGNLFPPNWKSIKKACPNNQLLQRTVQIRFNPTKDRKIRKKYIRDVFRYLEP